MAHLGKVHTHLQGTLAEWLTEPGPGEDRGEAPAQSSEAREQMISFLLLPSPGCTGATQSPHFIQVHRTQPLRQHLQARVPCSPRAHAHSHTQARHTWSHSYKRSF